MPKTKTKISQWLCDNSDGHAIQEYVSLAYDFKKRTGSSILHNMPRGYLHTVKETRKRLASDHRGGECRGDDNVLAPYICSALGVEFERKMGRGFQFQACLGALVKAGH